MSTAVSVFAGKMPARFKDRELDATTKALAGSGATGRRISIKGSVFRMIVDGKQVAENEDRAMNIIVVAAAPDINRQYYEGTYNDAVVTAPTCWSVDGKTPAADSEVPQSKSCDTCPQNIAGSGQGESRACRYQMRLAVVLEGELDGPVYQLAIPATSLFGKSEPNNVKMPLKAYARFLVENNARITDVVTEMRFDTKSATPKLTFKPVRVLTDAEAAIVEEQGQTADAHSAITLSVFKTDTKNAAKPTGPVVKQGERLDGREVTDDEEVEEEAAPATKAKVKKAVATAKPPVEEMDDAEEAEPVVAAKAKPAAPAGKRPLASVIDEWND